MRFYKAIIQPLLHVLPLEDRRKGIWIIVLMLANALLDFFSVASFLPLLFLVINPHLISENEIVNRVYLLLKFQSEAAFVISIASCIIILMLIKTAVGVWISRKKAEYAFTLACNLSTSSLKKYLEIAYTDFINIDFTTEMNRIANLPLALTTNVLLPLANIISEGMVCLLLIGCVILYDPRYILFFCVISLPIVLLYILAKHYLRELSNSLRIKYPQSLKYALQTIESFLEIKVFSKADYFTSRFKKLSEELKQTLIKEHILQSSTSRLVELVAAIIICTIIIYVTWSQKEYQQTLLLLSIYAGVSFRIIPSLNRILTAIAQIKANEHLCEELNPPIYNRAHHRTNEQIISFEHSLICNRVSFSYKENNVLEDITLLLKKGEKAILYGPSGSGKTTLMLVMMGLLEAQKGSLFIDGKKLQKSNNNSWLSCMSYVPQNPILLDATIAENIAFGVPADEIELDKLHKLVKLVKLDIMIDELPEKLNTRIFEKGVQLSGGQRQRLAIARALYKQCEILFLDEITNHLDQENEKGIMEIIQMLSRQNKTIVMITHNTLLQKYFDRFFKIDKGKLSEVITEVQKQNLL